MKLSKDQFAGRYPTADGNIADVASYDPTSERFNFEGYLLCRLRRGGFDKVLSSAWDAKGKNIHHKRYNIIDEVT